MTSAILRAIASPAVLAQIFSQLSPGSNEFEDPDNADYEEERENRSSLRSALAACARVCRAFSGPALDAQWKVLDDVVALLKILPHTLTDPDDDSGPEIDKDTNTYHLNVLNLSSKIDDIEWARLREVAQRVRELNACPPDCFIHPGVWTTLATRLQGTPLLPHLRCLHISVIYNDPTAFVLCLSPTLQELSFTAVDAGGHPMPTKGEFVDNIVTIISATEELPFSSYRQLTPLAPECTEVIAQHLRSIGRLSRLEVLNLVPAACRIGIPALRALSTLSSLHTLRLVVPLKDEDKDAALSLEGLAAVRHLHLSGDVEGIRRVMAALPPSGLRHLYLRISGSKFKDIERDFGAMRHNIPTELESFECVFFGPISDDARPLLRLFNAFLKFSHLKYFAVHMMMGNGVHLSDSDLLVFGSRWPDLERFAVVSWELPNLKHAARKHGRPTIAGLIELARSCPRLHLIRVPGLDVRTLPAASAMPEHGHLLLRYLDPHVLVNDKKADLDEIARGLDDLFPGLVDVPQKYIEYNATEESVSWDKVQALMQARRAARREAGSDTARGDHSH
ncbi:hypothetical protein GSI_04896 [Ganoderma sinense ZZ0214-1]|uniref:F-box domain-containing protein n=1 Tax=Ganoderma sinense ZZ0214-1 TaxID=1077348 RepID=A0A2G8SG85_9APHY|nr:hypothetical protein GSI_04896 [Ganoderma sinense ZZ0214-1]